MNAAVRADAQIDIELLNKVAAGDRAAFGEIYLAYHQRLARFLARFVRRHDLVEEVINDSMMVVWKKAGEFRGESRPSTWILGIAYRCALKTLRNPVNRMFDAPPMDEDALLAPDELGASETGEWIALAMQQLPAEQRLTLELAYGQGHSCEEIGAIMGCPANTVKTRMFHARAKLRAILPRLAGTACA